MRVLMIANTLPPTDISGVGEQVIQLATGLRGQDVDVEILGRGVGGVGGPKSLFPLMAVLPVLRAIKRFRPHVVQVHESDGAFAALAVATVRSLLAIPPVIVGLLQVSYWQELNAVRSMLGEFDKPAKPSSEEHLFRWLKAPLQILLGWLTTSLCDHLIAPSRVTAAELMRDYRTEVVEVVPNAMGHRKVDMTAVEGLPSDRPILLFVGRLRIRKGVDILLEAFNLVRHENGVEGATLVIAGDGEHREEVEQRARRLELGCSVVFLGRCNSGQVSYLLDRTKALVVPSIYEGMPLVILEAMDAGVPVVASRVSGIPEIVEDGETGWLVETGSVDSLAAALTEVLSDLGEAQRRGEGGRQRLDSLFRPKLAASQWLKIVQNIPR